MSDVALYHGTRAGYSRGGIVLPGDLLTKDNHALGRSDAVYVTPDFDLAAAFAVACKGSGKPKVLEVVPQGPLTRDDSTVAGEEHESYRTSWATVVKVTVLTVRSGIAAGGTPSSALTVRLRG